MFPIMIKTSSDRRTKIKCEIEMTKVMPEDVIKDREELHSRLQKKMVTLWCILLSSIITEHEEGIPLHIPPSERHFMLCASVQQNLRADLLSCEGLGSRLSTIYAWCAALPLLLGHGRSLRLGSFLCVLLCLFPILFTYIASVMCSSLVASSPHHWLHERSHAHCPDNSCGSICTV